MAFIMKVRPYIGTVLVVCMLVTAVACEPRVNLSPVTSDFIYVDNGNDVSIYEYTGLGGDVIIPGSIDGKNVTSIGRGAFFRCKNLTSVTMPDGILIIGEAAFFGCEQLTYIIISNSATAIGEMAFFGCESLANITIPDSVIDIGDGAFACMIGYYDKIDENGQWSGGRCFANCPNLIVTCPRNSYAHQYCVENNIKFQLTD